MIYTLPDLPYPFDALEPHIDAKTMEIHHDKHHAAYVAGLNKAFEGRDTGGLSGLSVEELLTKIDTVPEDIRTAVRTTAAVTQTTACSGRPCRAAAASGRPAS